MYGAEHIMDERPDRLMSLEAWGVLGRYGSEEGRRNARHRGRGGVTAVGDARAVEGGGQLALKEGVGFEAAVILDNPVSEGVMAHLALVSGDAHAVLAVCTSERTLPCFEHGVVPRKEVAASDGVEDGVAERVGVDAAQACQRHTQLALGGNEHAAGIDDCVVTGWEGGVEGGGPLLGQNTLTASL